MTPAAGFTVGFSATLLFLGLVFLTGFRARRVQHVVCVGLTLASLGVTIYFAYGLGHIYDLAAAGWITPVHLTLARVTTASLLLPAATGLWTVFVPSTRKLHKKLAFLALGLTLLTAVTGFWMLHLAPLAPH